MALYLTRSMRSEPLMRVGPGFGLNRYSSVSSAVMRVNTKLQKDKEFKARLECIESNILKGQTRTLNCGLGSDWGRIGVGSDWSRYHTDIY